MVISLAERRVKQRRVIVEIGDDVGLRDRTRGDRVHQLADVVDGGRAGIDEDAGTGHGGVVHLAHGGV